MSRTLTSTLLASAVIATWLGVHVWAVFALEWNVAGLIALPVVILLQTWLSVGLFIIAHDCMHGSLAPGRPAVNRAVGQLCLLLYAGFSFARLNAKHHLHHAHAGTEGDPDFHAGEPPSFWPWYGRFMVEYFGWREYLSVTALFIAHLVLTGAEPVKLLMFWSLPSILAGLQLFYYGTYLPHCPGADAFTDRHRTRSNEYSWLWSLVTCFHFGYHHEHHEAPGTPWWRLPAIRETVAAPRGYSEARSG